MVQSELYVNKTLSSALRVNPLKDGEVAVYALIQVKQLSEARTNEQGFPVDPATGNPITLGVKQFLGEQTIYDRGDGRTKTIKNVVSYTPVVDEKTGETRHIPKTEPVTFRNGFLRVTSKEQDTYAFIERMPGNMSNKFREAGAKNIFFRLDPEKKIHEEAVKLDAKADAFELLATADFDELRVIAKQMQPDLLDIAKEKTLRKALRIIADKRPAEVIHASENKDIKTRLLISEGQHYNFIIYDDVERTWRKNFEDFVDYELEVEVGKDPEDVLAEYLNSRAGNQQKRKLQNAIETKFTY